MVKFMYGYPHINAIFIIQKKLLNNEYITMKEHMILVKTEDLIHEYLENEGLSIFKEAYRKTSFYGE
nr:hypothetical protein [Mammaliicoccus sp. Marseille-Q6498]